VDPQAVPTRLAAVLGRIRAAEQRYHRPVGSVGLVAVSKRQPAAAIRAAYAAGQCAFGESYVQEALTKQAELADLDIEWHFIGRIQSNKTRQIAAGFAWVHSLCDARHAERLNAQRPLELPPLQACVQVDTSGEASKEGLAPDAVGDLLDACAGLERICIRGLMTLPARARDEAGLRRPFGALRDLRDRLATAERSLDVLSMGMSDDLEAAVAEGATLVRIGTAVFGPRPV
jgi:pyridoxal phosphate enzyme (YggS family)